MDSGSGTSDDADTGPSDGGSPLDTGARAADEGPSRDAHPDSDTHARPAVGNAGGACHDTGFAADAHAATRAHPLHPDADPGAARPDLGAGDACRAGDDAVLAAHPHPAAGTHAFRPDAHAGAHHLAGDSHEQRLAHPEVDAHVGELSQRQLPLRARSREQREGQQS
ncbi:MAG: hypothetical protein Q4G43_03990 [Mobilicoccus sp.]|nr:hypothetical protein [Mobilicoccus sp.]